MPGSVLDAADTPDGLEVTLSDGSQLPVAAVLNCTGTCSGARVSDDPLIATLVDSGIGWPGSLDLGLDVDDDGRVRAAAAPPSPVWTIGPLRRAQLWESTAIPEIRDQAAQLAAPVLAALPAPQAQTRTPSAWLVRRVRITDASNATAAPSTA